MQDQTKSIYCCHCQNQVQARLTNGLEIYPHRPDLYHKNIWKCGICKNYVGCHDKSKNPTKELGFIAGPEMKKARQHIHAILDPMWKDKKDRTVRGRLYNIIAKQLGKREYHTAEIKNIEEARQVYRIIKNLPNLLQEAEINQEKVCQDYLAIKPIKGKKYLVNYKGVWREDIFKERKERSCQLHGEPYLDYIFENSIFSVDGDLSLEKRTEELKKMIKPLELNKS
tara:strand:- start:2015 stop:2692 length:678 start_codon:yes stop_codon:yes gene_type:complete